MRRMITVVLAILSGLLCQQAVLAAAPAAYMVTPYQPAGAARAVDLNRLGHIAGMVFPGAASAPLAVPADAFLSSGDQYSTIGMAGFRITGLNNLDQLVGIADGAQQRPRAYLVERGQMQELGTLGGPASAAMAINDAGQIVGYSSVNDWDYRAFVAEKGEMRELGAPGSVNAAFDINNRGQVVGDYLDPGGNTRAFLYADGVSTDLGTLGGAWASATDISEDGRILGLSRTADGTTSSFVFEDGHMRALPFSDFMHGLRASGINSAGDVVGLVPFANPRGAYLWSGGELYDIAALVDPDWRIADPMAINDLGQIAASGCYRDKCSAVLLTPVPEPQGASMLLAGIGLTGLLVLRARRRELRYACQ